MACCTVATAAKRAARRWSSSICSVVNELHRNRSRYHSGFDPFVQEEANSTTTPLAVIERPVIDVHTNKRVRLAAIESARETHRVVQRILAMVETVRDARAQMPGHFLLNIPRHVLADDVSTEGKRQSGLLQPPRPHVGDEMQPVVLVCELAFVDQQSRVD